ncbi:IspD/TarI family cytidylyltransferase [Lactococcus protaetiae]|uniref:2-C-methyl-D-erythritol 4-phosphate cytidylyltransferase n=1 Tax=Lactococcus protaetiae TaxID=2592653 RepID=A0A514Z7A0_9LACT|nr:IspD/TarI family cytidylyltransferase [Lactococcus protaetiae]QDK70478.1 2-C-methyl-D-erythritol 4-phosphate cytidylyltransferase [Lactococcus protaetiae]
MKIALLTAGGVGSRMKQEVPKQFIHVNDKPIIVYSLDAFQKHPEIDAIVVACLDGWENVLMAYARQYNITKLKHIVPAGQSGQESIRNGLLELEKYYDKNDIVLVHDGVRPMLSQDVISDCIVVTEKYGCGIASIPTVEAVLYSDDAHASREFYDRTKLQRTQTPHGFALGQLLDMHREAAEKGITDTVASCTLAIELGREVYFSMGSEKNLKVTTMDDLDIFKALLLAEEIKQ